MTPPPGDPTDPETLSRRRAFRGRGLGPTRLQRAGTFLRQNEWFWAALFLVLLLSVFTRHFRIQPPPALPVGSAAPRDIRAPFDLQIQDEVATRQKREEARARVAPLYDWDSDQGTMLVAKVSASFAAGRNLLEEYQQSLRQSTPARGDRREVENRLLDSLAEQLGSGLSRFALRELQSERLSLEREQIVAGVVQGVAARKIVADGDPLPRYSAIRIRDIRRPGAEWEQRDPGRSEIISLSTARRLPGDAMEGVLGLSAPQRGALEEYARSLLAPNLTFNSQETARRQDEAARQIEPLVVFVKKGQLLLREGDQVDDSARQKIDAFQTASRAILNVPLLVSIALFLLLLLAFLFMYLKTYRKQHGLSLDLFVLVLQILLLSILLSEGMLTGLRSLAETVRSPLLGRPELLVFLLPVAAGAMLVTLLVDKHVAVVYALAHAILFGLLLESDFPMMLYALLSGFTGVYAAYNLTQRGAQWKASLLLGVVNALLALAVLANDPLWDEPHRVVLPAALAFLSALPLTTMLVSPLVPLFESAYGLLTEVRLLQLSNMNHPLLRRLSLDAPGTYNHSVMMATLSEAAANAVGANGLFCRVACYYHDIGKILNPVYFVENQGAGGNPHDKLTPRISSLIIAAHVKEGMAMARQYRLPQAVLDIIPQHHGTRRIHYFYDKALTLHDPEKGEIQEGDYRYPGPRPQTREAAIIMMADGVEAGSRVLKDPSHQRLRSLVEEIVGRVVDEQQLDECDLNFRDLAKVQDAFHQILIGVFTRRISYPGYRFDKEDDSATEGSDGPEGDAPAGGRR